MVDEAFSAAAPLIYWCLQPDYKLHVGFREYLAARGLLFLAMAMCTQGGMHTVAEPSTCDIAHIARQRCVDRHSPCFEGMAGVTLQCDPTAVWGGRDASLEPIIR